MVPVHASTTLMDHIANSVQRNTMDSRTVILAIVTCTDRLIVSVTRAVVSVSADRTLPVGFAILARMVSTDILIVPTATVTFVELWNKYATRTRAPACVGKVTEDHAVINVFPAITTIRTVCLATVPVLVVLLRFVTSLDVVRVWRTLADDSVRHVWPDTISIRNVYPATVTRTVR